ncbi:MAG: trimeric intracellular cation channel family protein [Betaproteobacteria bacterium]|uniref:Trimeric intracellular cation channel family protein n=1 Tax=Candidatus Proximibacter danicus TaxID=2954365 RepID=A0A9D7JZG0_9PROT|nr:trimeric intracellular cation channel family protein [Candidatus Proximibacter danicus]MBK9447582.1 trimeric intracellular cation channel family protein [Betaproteobacteria bacterium]
MAEFIYWIGMAAVAVSALTGVMEAERKEVDLIGATFVAVATALGGGTLRDLLLNRNIFWIADQTYLITAVLCGFAAFFVLRKREIEARWFLIPDAIGLALFTAIGTQAALQWHAPWLAASLLGVITGVFGGILRDVLCNEIPLVMRGGELYASAAWAGALLFISLQELGVHEVWSSTATMAFILVIRLAAIRYHLTLPAFPVKR